MHLANLVLLCAPALCGSPYDLIPPLALDAELNYDFGGSTTLTRNEVRLTMENAGEKGFLVSKYNESPLPDNFEVTLEFRVDGSGRNLYGDGMAFWFLEELPGLGGLMGFNEFYKGVSLVVDTYRNGRGGRAFPRLLVMQNDGTRAYDKANDGRANEIDGCSMRGLHNNKRQDVARLHISYSQSAGRLVVNMNYRDKWEPCITADLNMGPVRRFAVSAATGELSDIHTVRSIRLEDLGTTISPSIINSRNKQFGIEKEKKAREDSEERRSQVSFFFRLIVGVFRLVLKLIVAAVLGVALFIAWKKVQRFRRSRDDRRYNLS